MATDQGYEGAREGLDRYSRTPRIVTWPSDDEKGPVSKMTEDLELNWDIYSAQEVLQL